jgi:RING-variant domain
MSDVGFGAQAVVHVTRSTSKEHEIKYLDDDEICWICHEGSHELNELQNFCQCKGLKCHKKCLSRYVKILSRPNCIPPLTHSLKSAGGVSNQQAGSRSAIAVFVKLSSQTGVRPMLSSLKPIP